MTTLPPLVPLERQLDRFAELGLQRSPDAELDDLFGFYDRAELEADPFYKLAFCLGIDLERPPWTPLCPRIWVFDAECVEDDGDYTAVLQRLIVLAGGVPEISAVSDRIDPQAGRVVVSLTVAGRPRSWTYPLHDDWLDEQLLVDFAALLAELRSPAELWSAFEGGQDRLLVGVDEAAAREFSALSRIELLRVLDLPSDPSAGW